MFAQYAFGSCTQFRSREQVGVSTKHVSSSVITISRRGLTYALVVETLDLPTRAYAPVAALAIYTNSILVTGNVLRICEDALCALIDVDAGFSVRREFVSGLTDAFGGLAETEAEHMVSTAAEGALARQSERWTRLNRLMSIRSQR